MKLSESKKEIVRRVNKIVWDCGDSVVKAFNEKKPASDVVNEALNLTRVNEAGIATPKLLEVSPLDNGCWALKTERFEALTLAELMSVHPEKTEQYLSDFVTLQLDIQSHTAPLLPRQKDKFARMINSLTMLNATTRYDLHMLLDGMQRRRRICHGDFNPTNVLVLDDGSFVILDWAHATQGTPAADVAMTYMLFSFDDEKLAKSYLDLYCERADFPKQVVYRWFPIVAAAELARDHHEHEEALLSWIDVADWQ